MIINPSMTSSNGIMLVLGDTVKWQQVPALHCYFYCISSHLYVIK